MTAKQDFNVGDALETLVNQFADKLSFLRELIQNAIDSGSPEIDVRLTFEPGDDPQRGTMVVHVDDYGEGMDATIIDTKLTRLFSSGKDGDFTKIGRFGIGFVSVFSIDPDAVCVDTSRGGESWRVLFKKDRTFSRIELDAPVDGTKIRVFKTATRQEFDAFTARAREVVTYWCKHAAAEIRFQGTVINQPLDVVSHCRVRYQDGDAERPDRYPRGRRPRGQRGRLHPRPRQGAREAATVPARRSAHLCARARADGAS